MTIQVTGKHMETGEAFQTFVIEKTRSVLEKYTGPEISGHVRVEKEKVGFQTSCSIRLNTGLLLEAQGFGSDAYASAEDALRHLEKRVRRYKRKLKDHHTPESRARAKNQIFVNDFIVQADDAAADDVTTEDGSDHLIVAETARMMEELSVSEAVMQLDLTNDTVLLFRNAASGRLNVVYRRKDGHIGWIDPEPRTANS
ncbi:MAG: ribosome-associated translation inhibitor RaiA [Pseudomonadota bacterium]